MQKLFGISNKIIEHDSSQLHPKVHHKSIRKIPRSVHRSITPKRYLKNTKKTATRRQRDGDESRSKAVCFVRYFIRFRVDSFPVMSVPRYSVTIFLHTKSPIFLCFPMFWRCLPHSSDF